MDYVLHPRPTPAENAEKPRLVSSRPSRNLRRGGGHKSVPGWTEQKRRTNRRRFDELRPFIKTGVTITYPRKATKEQLAKLRTCSEEFCKENAIPAREVMEGPGCHSHIALGIEHSPEIEQKWLKRFGKRWQAVLGVKIGPDAFLWKPDIEPERIASYLSKTWTQLGKHRIMAKGSYPWMPATPSWETGFRKLAPPNKPKNKHNGSPRKTRGKPANVDSHKVAFHPYSPNYTIRPLQTSENEGEMRSITAASAHHASRQECVVCRNRWGASLWAGSCRCNPSFPDCPGA